MSIWFMFDNHTFKRLSDNFHEAGKEAIELFDKDNYGSIGLKGSSGTGLVTANGNKEEFVKKVQLWILESEEKLSRNSVVEI